MSTQIGEIEFGSTRIAFAIHRSAKRSTVAVTVHPNTAVSVVAPTGTRRIKINELVSGKAEWILRQQEYFRQHHNGYAKQFVSGESFFYLGRQHTLKVKRPRGDTTGLDVQLLQGQLRVTVPKSVYLDDQADQVRQRLMGWYRRQARARIPAIANRYAKALGFRVGVVQIRDMKKRWGSADQEGRLAFNWRIIMAPRRLVEYVVAHELCHLKHHDHSKAFWKLLERIMPDYERRRMELAVHGPKYDLRLKDGPT